MLQIVMIGNPLQIQPDSKNLESLQQPQIASKPWSTYGTMLRGFRTEIKALPALPYLGTPWNTTPPKNLRNVSWFFDRGCQISAIGYIND
jgi:hypothetical protein